MQHKYYQLKIEGSKIQDIKNKIWTTHKNYFFIFYINYHFYKLQFY